MPWRRAAGTVLGTCGLTGCFLLPASLAAAPALGPFAAVKGTYWGLFSETNQVTQTSAGAFTLTTTAQGRLSGSLQTGTGRYQLSGQLDATGTFTKTVLRPRLNALSVTVTVDLTGGTDRITGSVSDGVWTAGLTGARAVFDGTKSIPAQMGLYTMMVPGDCAVAGAPCGDSYGTVSISRKGSVRLSAVMADGTRFTQTAGMSGDGQWPLYARLYGGQGSVWSWLTFSNPPAGDMGGGLNWLKSPQRGAKYYGEGFVVAALARGSAYLPPGRGARLLNVTNASLVLSGGELAQNLLVSGALGTDNRVRLGNKSSLSFSVGTGLFRGKAFNPATSKPLSFGGVVLQNQSLGCGSFLGQNQSGRVRFGVASEVGYGAQFETLGRAFAPAADVESALLQTLYWTWSDGTVSFDYPNTSKQFGSPLPRQQYLAVYPPDALVAINLGFDGADNGWRTPLPYLAPQDVAAVYFPAPLTSLRYWASSYNPITNTLDFTGFSSLEIVECFACTNLPHVAVANLPALRRICLEQSPLRELDISGDPNLEEVRAALSGYTHIKVGGGTGPKVWHWCVRDNPQLAQPFQAILTNFFSIQDLWIARDNQSGALRSVSTNLTSVWADDNFYTYADLSGQPGLTFCSIQNNGLTNLVLGNCASLQELDVQQNQFTTPVLDALLALLDSTGANLTTVNLSQNLERPSAAGYTHYTNLVSRGVAVSLDF